MAHPVHLFRHHPELYERERLAVTRGKFLLIEGKLQNQDNVIHVKAAGISTLHITNAPVTSQDFH